MMSLLADLPIWAIALIIFSMRMVDVTLGTVRTIAVVNGHTILAVILGFVEISIWITAVSAAVARVSDDPILVAAFAGGFAAGNAVGIVLERRMALGSCVVRMITSQDGHDVANAIGRVGTMVTTFTGQSESGSRALVYALCSRRLLPGLLAAAKHIDPHIFYAVDRFAETGFLTPSVQPTGWRATFKKK